MLKAVQVFENFELVLTGNVQMQRFQSLASALSMILLQYRDVSYTDCIKAEQSAEYDEEEGRITIKLGRFMIFFYPEHRSVFFY